MIKTLSVAVLVGGVCSGPVVPTLPRAHDCVEGSSEGHWAPLPEFSGSVGVGGLENLHFRQVPS